MAARSTARLSRLACCGSMSPNSLGGLALLPGHDGGVERAEVTALVRGHGGGQRRRRRHRHRAVPMARLAQWRPAEDHRFGVAPRRAKGQLSRHLQRWEHRYRKSLALEKLAVDRQLAIDEYDEGRISRQPSRVRLPCPLAVPRARDKHKNRRRNDTPAGRICGRHCPQKCLGKGGIRTIMLNILNIE